MRNQANRKFQFGLLNNGQDAVDIKDIEAQDLNAVDIDQVVLGTLQKSALIQVPQPTGGKSFDVSVLNGRHFRLNSGEIEYNEQSDTGTWRKVNQDTHPEKSGNPTITIVSGADVDVTEGDITGIEFRVNPTTGFTAPAHVETTTYDITIDGVGPDTFEYSITQIGLTVVQATGVSTNAGNWIDLVYGVQVKFPTSGWSATLSDTSSAAVSQANLEDGEYGYICVAVKSDGIVPAQEIESLPTEPQVTVLANFGTDGSRQASVLPQIEFPSVPLSADEVWLYRKDPQQEDYIRIARYDGSDVHFYDGSTSLVGTDTFVDAVNLASMATLDVLPSREDEEFDDLNTAIGNTVGTFDKIFEKDNRLWAVPTGRPDLLLYSRLGDWWGWQRINSFSFDGDVVDLTFVRDTTVVGGEFTTVIFTTNGIYHITGSGVETSPYNRVLAVPEIQVEPSSVVNMTDILMFMTKSDNQGYDEGRFGQKVYTYNLTQVLEVSGRVRNSSLIQSSAGIQYAEMRGSDKYLVKKTGVDRALVYNRATKGWGETTEAVETSGLWYWESKWFTPELMEMFKIAYARKFKIDYDGAIKITFTIQGATSANEQSFELQLADQGTRAEVLQRMPSVKGRKWKMKIESESSDGAVYDFYFVQ